MVVFLLGLEISRHNYFLPKLRDNFFVYNLLNSTNTLVIIASTYLAWLAVSHNFQVSNKLLSSHALLTYGGSLLLELVRKVEEKGVDGYLHYLSVKVYFYLIILAQLISLGAFWLNFSLDRFWPIFLLFVLNLFIFARSLQKEKFQIIKSFCLFFYLACLFVFYYALNY